MKNDLEFDDFIYEEIFYERNDFYLSKVHHKNSKEIYAVKIINLRANQTEIQVKSEIDILEKLYNMAELPNFFPEYYGYSIEKSLLKIKTYHIFFKYYPENLKNIVKRQEISNNYEQIKNYFYQIINGLAFLEICGIVHRNIKSENFLLDTIENKLFIFNFQYAQKLKDIGQNKTQFYGLKANRCPQWFHSHLNGVETCKINSLKSDCFSLGMIALEILE